MHTANTKETVYSYIRQFLTPRYSLLQYTGFYGIPKSSEPDQTLVIATFF